MRTWTLSKSRNRTRIAVLMVKYFLKYVDLECILIFHLNIVSFGGG